MQRKLRKYRNEANITQAQLADKVGVSVISVRKYESCERNPSIKVAKKICCFFNKKLEEVFPDIFLLR